MKKQLVAQAAMQAAAQAAAQAAPAQAAVQVAAIQAAAQAAIQAAAIRAMPALLLTPLAGRGGDTGGGDTDGGTGARVDPQTKALSKGIASGAALVNQTADFVADKGTTQAVEAVASAVSLSSPAAGAASTPA